MYSALALKCPRWNFMNCWKIICFPELCSSIDLPIFIPSSVQYRIIVVVCTEPGKGHASFIF